MYIEPKIESSYYSNNKGKKSGEVYFNPKIGETIYNYIIESKPKVVVEFGVLFGYSTVCEAYQNKIFFNTKLTTCMNDLLDNRC